MTSISRSWEFLFAPFHKYGDENPPCNPVGPYALSKYNAELRAIEISRESGMALTILRLATLYGEEDPGNVGRLMRTLDRGRFLWIGDGSNRKSSEFGECH
ncbi:MAG: NAD-dependent epimerase/dehydratase family protein [Candidatus Desulfaltia sp.]|nr:NAD-dependent epimerase/dehydratase family protein [Candidatus Desulfaltia sp.]